MKQRLLAKEGVLRRCLKKYVALRSSVRRQDLADCKVKCDDLNKELDTWEFSIGKAAVISDCNTREITEYEEVLRQIELSITGTQKEIEELKVQLEKERILRQQKEEYEAISRLINELPPRADTEQELAKLNMELSELNEEGSALQSKMDLRSKQFHLLLHTVQDLQTIIAQEEDSSTATPMDED